MDSDLPTQQGSCVHCHGRVAISGDTTVRPAPDELRPLTERQHQVIEVYIHLLAETGQAPTLRMMLPVLKVRNPNGLVCHLKSLASKGWLLPPPPRESGRQVWRLTEAAAKHLQAVEAQAGLVRSLRVLPEEWLEPAQAEALAEQLLAAAGEARRQREEIEANPGNGIRVA